MNEKLISFETAKLAKQYGFDIPVIYGYSGLGICKDIVETDYGADFINQYKNLNDIEVSDTEKDTENWEEWVLYSAPSQSLLQKWLREKHHLIIIVAYQYEHDSTPYSYWIYKEFQSLPINQWVNDLNTYEEALELGLQEALKLI